MKTLRLMLALPLLLAGCQLPPLPKLPRLPNAQDFAQALPVGSSGQSLKDAVAIALPVADAWAAGAVWVSVTGLKLDPGGRNGGHPEGVWIFTFQAEAQPDALEIRVAKGQATQRPIGKKVYAAPPLPRDLAGVLDSTDAVAKAGVGGRSLTVVLRHDPEAGPLYNIVEEGGTARAVLDAKTGEKKPE
jgi:hypothetical protein